MPQSYFGVTLEGNIVYLGVFNSEYAAENAAASYGDADTCAECERAPDDVIYFGSREHFNAMFDKLEPSS